MSITIEELESERAKLKKDFDDLKDKIGKVEVDLGTMRGNLNALNGAIQFSTNLTEREKELMKKDDKKKK